MLCVFVCGSLWCVVLCGGFLCVSSVIGDGFLCVSSVMGERAPTFVHLQVRVSMIRRRDDGNGEATHGLMRLAGLIAVSGEWYKKPESVAGKV